MTVLLDADECDATADYSHHSPEPRSRDVMPTLLAVYVQCSHATLLDLTIHAHHTANSFLKHVAGLCVAVCYGFLPELRLSQSGSCNPCV